MLPKGFIDLIKKVIKEYPLEQDPLDKAELWKDFTWCVFVKGDIRTNADINYIHETLWNAGILEKELILKKDEQEWIELTKKFLNVKIPSLDGNKRGALSGLMLTKDIKCLKEAALFFDRNNMSANFLRSKTIDKNTTDNFLNQITSQPESSYITGKSNLDKIFNIGLTKAILWLQTYGLTKDYCPPSGQIKSFVNNEIKKLSWFQKKTSNLSDWEYILLIRNFNKKEIIPVIPEATTRDTGLAIWFWKTAQTLLTGSRLKNEFTPIKLLEFMKSNGIDLLELNERMSNIDKVKELTDNIKEFLNTSL
jgi:hypothetical protein